MKLIAKILLVTLMAQCSVEPEDGKPGECPIDCKGAIIGASDQQYSIVSQVGQSLTSQCPEPSTNASNKKAANPVTVRFVAQKKTKNSLGEEITRPVPSISFSPMLTGDVASVTTTDSEFCSDSCGVMKYTFVPNCPATNGTNTIQLNLSSGALKSETFTLTVTVPTEEK